MKKNIVEVYFDKDITENDVIVCHNKKWIAINKSIFLNETNKKISDTNQTLEEEKNKIMVEIDQLKQQIRDLEGTINFLLGEDEHEEE